MITLVLVSLPLRPLGAAPRCFPNTRFVVLSGGMVRDTLTSLVWQQDASGPRIGCTDTDLGSCTLAEAQNYCSGLTLGGYSDWRVPTVKELLSIVDHTKAHPAPTIDEVVFPNTPPVTFWTSSPSSNTYQALYVYFATGGTEDRNVTSTSNVRCVR